MKSSALNDDLKPILSSIDQVSREIKNEAKVGQSSELRTTRLTADNIGQDVGILKKDFKVLDKQLENLKTHIRALEKGSEVQSKGLENLKEKVTQISIGINGMLS